MSVIGRLDEQVDAVLIAPLRKGGGRKAGTTPQDAKGDETAGSSSQTSKSAEPVGGKVSEDKPSTTAGRDPLPVWLL